MAREYNALMPGNALVTSALPFWQLASSATKQCKLLGFELTCEGANAVTSQNVILTLARRSAASTTFANTAQNIARLDPDDTAAGASLSWGITTVAGTLTEITHRWAFNALSGCVYVPVPELRDTLPVSAWWTMQLNAAPSPTLTFSMNFYFSEGFT